MTGDPCEVCGRECLFVLRQGDGPRLFVHAQATDTETGRHLLTVCPEDVEVVADPEWPSRRLCPVCRACIDLELAGDPPGDPIHAAFGHAADGVDAIHREPDGTWRLNCCLIRSGETVRGVTF